MSNNQATIEDLIDEMYDVLDKGWKLPLSGGKVFVDGEEVRQILDEIKEEIPAEVRKAKAIVADRAQIISEAQREAETIIRVAEEKQQALVNQDEVVRQAQAKANDLIAQAQAKFKEMRKASNDYVDDLMRRTDESLSENLAELRKTRQNIKSSQRDSQIQIKSFVKCARKTNRTKIPLTRCSEGNFCSHRMGPNKASKPGNSWLFQDFSSCF